MDDAVAIVTLPLAEIHPDPMNPRNNQGAVEIVAASIRRYGFLVPIVLDKDRKIVAGHTRYLAARMMRLETVPCVQADDLTPELAREFAIAENRTSDFSFFDLEKLAALADEMSDEFIADFDMDTLLSQVDDESVLDVPDDRLPEKREGLDLAPFEKYQYVCIICRTTYDYTNLLQRLGLEDLQRAYVGKFLKRGASTGRVIEYPEFLRRIDGE